MKEFRECSMCARKQGSPVLCESCLHNRRLVNKLRARVDRLRARVAELEGVVETYRCLARCGTGGLHADGCRLREMIQRSVRDARKRRP
jgi:hypothetical protein